MINFRFLSFILLIIWSVSSLWAGIPTKYLNDPSIDLVYKNRHLLPEEVHDLYIKSKGKIDLSTLNPVEDTDLWEDKYPKVIEQEKITLMDLDEVTYNSVVLTESGAFRFNAISEDQDGKVYTLMLSKNIHSILLAKTLLTKIGYRIPSVRYLPRIVINFKNENQKKGFLSQLSTSAMAGNPKNWVVEEEETKLVLQDLVAMDSFHEIYNLAVGVTEDMIQNRRLLSSLAVPLSIVNLTESVNMFRWSAGAVVNSEVNLSLPNLDDFNCTWNDARWITRRIEKLTRDDWREIVASTHIPKAVQTILVEKLISRRNSVMKLFKIDAEEIKVDSEVSNGTDLVKGKLTKQNWPGYASRFAYGDPESPLSSSEIKSWILSKTISTTLDSAVSALNIQSFMGYRPEVVLPTSFKDALNQAAKDSIKSGLPSDLAIGGAVIPFVQGQLILSRNLMTGTYLGTDNLVQMVDTVGVNVNGGVSFGLAAGTSFNLDPDNATAILSAKIGAEMSVTRTYAHLRPVTNVKVSLKYPFKNIIVPLVHFNYGAKLKEAINVSFDEQASEEQKQIKIQEALKPIKENLLVGESLIVTDSLETSGGLQGSFGYKALFKIALGISPGHSVISRFHVHRKTEDEFHIYKDLGEKGFLGLGLEMNTLVPIGKIGFKTSSGHARVKFYSLNLNHKNPDALLNASALRRAIILQSTKDLDDDEKTKPFIIKHKFSENDFRATLFVWQWEILKSTTEMSVQNPQGDTRYFRRHFSGDSNGVNYQAYVFAMISNWISLIVKKSFDINDGTSNNPGYSFYGKGEVKFATFDEEVTKDGAMIEPFIKVSTIKNGWSVTRKKANQMLDELKMKYRYDFFNAPVLNDTQRIFMYNISVNLLFYRSGIEHLFTLSDEEIKRIFRENHAQKDLVINPVAISDGDSGSKRFLKLMEDFRYYERREDKKKANKALMDAFLHADKELNLNGLVELMGGEENLYMQAKIDGFREGDEDGDKALISSSLGEYGSKNILGPLTGLQRRMNMLEGEFFIYWIMTRLI